MEGPLSGIHHLRQCQPRHNLEVDSLALPSNFYGGCFIINSTFLGTAARFVATLFVSLLREILFISFLNTVGPSFSPIPIAFLRTQFLIIDALGIIAPLSCIISLSTG
jgi:hypothetical protein